MNKHDNPLHRHLEQPAPVSLEELAQDPAAERNYRLSLQCAKEFREAGLRRDRRPQYSIM